MSDKHRIFPQMPWKGWTSMDGGASRRVFRLAMAIDSNIWIVTMTKTDPQNDTELEKIISISS